MKKTGMSITNSHRENYSIERQIELFARVGFDSFFLSCGVTDNFERIPYWANISKDNGIIFEAVHSPTEGVNNMWLEGHSADNYISRTKNIIDMCALGNVDKLILHTAYGNAPEVSEIGLERFLNLEEYAQKANVHLCYENADIVTHLLAILEHSGDYHGFCFDNGHHFCYTPDIPLLDIVGDKLIYTHLHDNLGFDNGKDLHLLPFDGKINWENISIMLEKIHYQGTYNLELSCNGKARYNEMSYKCFVEEAYNRIQDIIKL